MSPDDPLFVVRLWDGFDGLWMDVSDSVSREEANRIWNEKTEKGTKNTTFNDIDYYRIFPADTQMRYSYESGLSQRDGELGSPRKENP